MSKFISGAYIGNYPKPHGSGGTGTASSMIIYKGGVGSSSFDPSNCRVTKLTANTGSIDNLTSKNASINNANILYLMSTEGQITKLSGEDLNYTYGKINHLSSDELTTNALTVKDTATIAKLIGDYIQSHEITTDYLTVTKSAHFFELIIDKIRSVQGTQMNTAANCTIDFVEAYNSNNVKVNITSNNIAYFRVYWKNTDGGKAITNDWLTLDQAICESFNVNAGASQDTSNKYYWRKVIATDNGTPKYVNLNTGQVLNSQPSDYNIEFSYLFCYGDRDTPDSYYDSFTVESQVANEWDGTDTWTPSSTLYGLQITPDQSALLMNSYFSFSTNTKTKLNVGVFYADSTFDYFPADTYKYDYSITTKTSVAVEAFILTTAVIEQWDACNWIDLSNTVMGATKSGKSAIPAAGDVLCQLGYRYTELAGYENTDAWRTAHKDEVSRASAIIIAAYQTPDNGDTQNNIPTVFPPSYAQYQNITDFNLTSHRGTYFDATGAYFKGTLAAGTTVDQGVSIPVTVDQWSFVGTPVIIKNSNNTYSPSTITLKILYTTGSSSTIYTTIPQGTTLYVNGTQVSSLTIASADTLNIELKDSNSDTLCATILNSNDVDVIADVHDGVDGDFYEWIYQEASIGTELDNNDLPSSLQKKFNQYTNGEKDGWTQIPPTIDPETDNLWMSQRFVSHTLNADDTVTINWGAWSTPMQINGENGEKGSDGAGVEFIYYRTLNNLTVPPLYQYRDDIPNYSTLTSAYIQYDASNDYRIVWWQEDGGSPIYNSSYTGFIPPSRKYNDIYLRTDWTDEPSGVDSSYMYEWISQRKSNNGVWGDFSTPVVWSKWGKNGDKGDKGDTGDKGDKGENGEEWKLIPINKTFAVNISTGNNYDNITGVIKTDLAFAVLHIDGDTATYLTSAELSSYNLRLLTDNSDGNKNQNLTSNVSTVTLADGTSLACLVYENSNYLTYTSGVSSGDYVNYYYLHRNNFTGRMPTQMLVKLMLGNAQMDAYQINLIFNPDHVFSVTDDALNSVYQGLSGDSGGSYTTGFSTIRQQWDAINLNVSNIQDISNGSFPTNTDYEQYAFYRNNSNTAPSAPSGNVTSTSTSVNNQWTLGHITPSSTYKYVWCCKRSKSATSYTHSTDVWSSWGSVALFEIYGSGRGYVNNATLDIKADNITTSISQTYQTKSDANTAYSHLDSKIDQTATGILSTVSSTYQTIDNMSYYSTTQQMNSAISQSANQISLEVNEVAKATNYLYSTDFISGNVLTTDANTMTLWYKTPDNDAVWVSSELHDGYNSVCLDLSYAPTEGYGHRAIKQMIDVSEMPVNTYLCLSAYVKTGSTTSSNVPRFGIDFYGRNSISDTTNISSLPITIDNGYFVKTDGTLKTINGGGSGSRRFCEVYPSDASYWEDTNWHQFYVVFKKTGALNYLYTSIYGYTDSSLGTTDLQFYIAQPQLIIGSEPTVYVTGGDGRYNENIRRTGIDITQGKIILDANNTEVTGNLDLRGTFTSEYDTYGRKIIVDAQNNTIKLIGPSIIDEYTEEPAPGSVDTVLATLDFYHIANRTLAGALTLYAGNDTIIITPEGVQDNHGHGKTWTQILS